MKLKKVYQVFIIDNVYDNIEEIGWYDNLEEASLDLKDSILFALQTGGEIDYFDKDGNKIEEDDLENYINVPKDFLKEYPSTFSSCIDRAYISFKELVDECFLDENGDQQVFLKDDSDDCYYDYEALCVRGFVHIWGEDIVDKVVEMYKC